MTYLTPQQRDVDGNASKIYPVPFGDVQADHVITALNQLLELGEEECMKLWQPNTISN